jgi:hypothetical protein
LIGEPTSNELNDEHPRSTCEIGRSATMGVDIIGKDPSSQIGRYFGRNWWAWGPLADYISETVPHIAAQCRHWMSNDGDGLNALEAKALADALESEIASGRCEAYGRARQAEMVEPCPVCDGAGIRVVSAIDTNCPFPIKVPVGITISCWRCHGAGSIRPASPSSSLSVETVSSLIPFLRDCGGFEIW